MYKTTFMLLLATLPISLFGQPEVEMADTLRSDGKIYVVVGIMLVILLGLIGYLFLMDRKVTHLEKKLNEKDIK